MASTIWFCIVVQWENENTVSVVNEKQVVGDVELTEGVRIVDVSIGQSKGRLAIYKATSTAYAIPKLPVVITSLNVTSYAKTFLMVSVRTVERMVCELMTKG